MGRQVYSSFPNAGGIKLTHLVLQNSIFFCLCLEVADEHSKYQSLLHEMRWKYEVLDK